TPLFRSAFGNAARADDHLPGNADKVSGGEFCARALIGVVVEHLAARFLIARQQLLAGRIAAGVPRLHIDQHDVEGCDRLRPDDAVVVVAGLDDRRYEPGRTDAVRTARHIVFLAVGAGHGGVHRPRILLAEVEDVPDLDAARREPGAFGNL